MAFEPAEVRDGALEVLSALLAAFSVWLAHRFERPLVSVVAVGALDAVLVAVTRVAAFVAYTHIATVL